MTDTEVAEAFDAIYRAHYDDLLRYALRRTCEPADAADVVAEVMTIAWRRRADLPPSAQCRLWLFGVARNVLANQRRGELRRSHLARRLRQELDTSVETSRTGDSPVLDALATLSARDQEVLALTAWEGLRPEEIAVVLDCSPVAARVRLHRARHRLRNVLEGSNHNRERATPLSVQEAT